MSDVITGKKTLVLIGGRPPLHCAVGVHSHIIDFDNEKGMIFQILLVFVMVKNLLFNHYRNLRASVFLFFFLSNLIGLGIDRERMGNFAWNYYGHTDNSWETCQEIVKYMVKNENKLLKEDPEKYRFISKFFLYYL